MIYKKYCFIFLSIILSNSCMEHQSTFPSEDSVNQQMNEVIQKSDLPAVVAIAINKNGEKLSYNYGEAIWSQDAEVTEEHIFRIWSMTVEEGDYDQENWTYKDAPRHFESGTNFLYGSSSDWAGKLVEKPSGLNLEDYFKKQMKL